jgi:hypothetical protein
LINALRAHLAEYGIVAGVGRNGLEKLLEVITDERDDRVPARASLRLRQPFRAAATICKIHPSFLTSNLC